MCPLCCRKEVCETDTVMCPRCDEKCQVWQLSDTCVYAKVHEYIHHYLDDVLVCWCSLLVFLSTDEHVV